MASERDVQRLRSAQVGILMRSYRESFALGAGRRGLSQAELLRRMGEVDDVYETRYSHGTVSRWESGSTRPSVDRLRVFGKALNLSETEVAGLILLAGLAPDFPGAALALSSGSDPVRQLESPGVVSEGVEPGDPDRDSLLAGSAGSVGGRRRRGLMPSLSAEVRLFFLRVLLLGLAFTAFGYLLSLPGWDGSLHTVPFAGFAVALVLGQGCLFPERQSGLREFFWVSIFFVLTTPLFQFAPLGLDHYNFHVLDAIRGTWIPCLMALLVNLVLASGAGVLFHRLHRWQYAGGETGGALRRALWVTLPPSVLVYGVAVVITNASVSIQLAFLVPVIATVFTALLVLRDPGVTFSERDRRILFPVVAATAMLCGTLGLVVIVAIYVSPDLPMVLPDHNLLGSWGIDFGELGITREQALDRLNVGYMWHAMSLFAYMAFVVGGSLIVAVYRMGGGGDPAWPRLRPGRPPVLPGGVPLAPRACQGRVGKVSAVLAGTSRLA